MDIRYHSIQLLYQIFKDMDWKHKKSETILYLLLHLLSHLLLLECKLHKEKYIFLFYTLSPCMFMEISKYLLN